MWPLSGKMDDTEGGKLDPSEQPAWLDKLLFRLSSQQDGTRNGGQITRSNDFFGLLFYFCIVKGA